MSLQMVLKSVIIVVVSILLGSVIVGGVIVVGQVLDENDPNTRNEVRDRSGERDSEDDVQERSSSSSSVPIPEEGKVVSIVTNSGSNSYNPSPLEIKAGETVTWINEDSSRHTATSSSNDGSTFDSDVLNMGETFSFTFDQEGEYPYFCTLHSSMVGTVIVTEP